MFELQYPNFLCWIVLVAVELANYKFWWTELGEAGQVFTIMMVFHLAGYYAVVVYIQSNLYFDPELEKLSAEERALRRTGMEYVGFRFVRVREPEREPEIGVWHSKFWLPAGTLYEVQST